jgi:hypothetical protein
MKNVVPFRAPAKFAEFGIDWTRAAQTETERRLREAFLTYETSCGPNGLVSILLLYIVARRRGSVADDPGSGTGNKPTGDFWIVPQEGFLFRSEAAHVRPLFKNARNDPYHDFFGGFFT